MDNSPIAIPPQNCINQFFWKAPNPMAITRAKDGTYIEVNEAFERCMGLHRSDMIGQTSVGIGYITAQQRLMIFDEIKEKGYAQNIELEVKVKKNETRCGLFNSSLIKTRKESLWLTVVTDISERRREAEARQEDILFKSLASVVSTGVILIRGHQRQDSYLFFMNEEARRALDNRSVKDLLGAIEGQESTYFNTNAGCFLVKTILSYYGRPWKIIMMEQLPYAEYVEEKLKHYDLTHRQEEITLLASMGHSNKEIARKLFIAEYTVKDHLKDIFQKLGVCKRSELCPKILQWR